MAMFNPCMEYCKSKLDKAYTNDCDSICEYASVAKENKKLKAEIEAIKKFVTTKEDFYYSKLSGGIDISKDTLMSAYACGFQATRYFIETYEETDN